MTLQLQTLHHLFGAEIVGCDVVNCPAQVAREVTDAIGRYGVLLFRNVVAGDDDLAGFAASFGPLQNMASRNGEWSDVARVTNLAEDGTMLPANDAIRQQHDANSLWHMDSTFRAPGATYSFLHARVVPEQGGDTEFCDTRIAWNALDRDRREALDEQTADHSIFHSRELAGVPVPYFAKADLPPIRRKLIREHLPSGRKALVIASHIENVSGLDYQAGQELVTALIDFASTAGRVYRHQWSVGDLLMWDNRCVMHRATEYPQLEQPRDMRSCRVEDTIDDGLA